MKKDSILFLKYFGIKHLSDLIGRKFLINVNDRAFDGEKLQTEICFQIQQYSFSVQNLTFIVPTIGLEGNSDIKNVILTFFPSMNETHIKYGISYQSDYITEEEGNKAKHIVLEGKKGSKCLRIKLL